MAKLKVGRSKLLSRKEDEGKEGKIKKTEKERIEKKNKKNKKKKTENETMKKERVSY